jgi:hypothetical protein
MKVAAFLPDSESSLTARALAAYYRSAKHPSKIALPDPARSGPVIHDDRAYVVLWDKRRIIAVYRLHTSGQLRRMRRWPQALNIDI